MQPFAVPEIGGASCCEVIWPAVGGEPAANKQVSTAVRGRRAQLQSLWRVPVEGPCGGSLLQL